MSQISNLRSNQHAKTANSLTDLNELVEFELPTGPLLPERPSHPTDENLVVPKPVIAKRGRGRPKEKKEENKAEAPKSQRVARGKDKLAQEKKEKPKTKKVKKAAIDNRQPKNISYNKMIIMAIEELDDKHGSSLQAISKFITNKLSTELTGKTKSFISRTIKKLLKDSHLVKKTGTNSGLTGSFVFSQQLKDLRKSLGDDSTQFIDQAVEITKGTNNTETVQKKRKSTSKKSETPAAKKEKVENAAE